VLKLKSVEKSTQILNSEHQQKLVEIAHLKERIRDLDLLYSRVNAEKLELTHCYQKQQSQISEILARETLLTEEVCCHIVVLNLNVEQTDLLENVQPCRRS